MAGAAGKLKALEQWCRARTTGYRDVDVKDMTRSWRSGLAFCALIHKYRPDLIDFESLSKENVLANNKLAFQTAERELGIPALLDAEDMVRLEVPDRLSVITYVAQYYNYFKDKEAVGGPSVNTAVKRQHALAPSASSAAKRTMSNANSAESSSSEVVVPAAAASADLCTLCGTRVYLLERFIDSGQLYHRSCHRQSTGQLALPFGPATATGLLPRQAMPDADTASSVTASSLKHPRDDEAASAATATSATSNAAKSAARVQVMGALAASMHSHKTAASADAEPLPSLAAPSPTHAVAAGQSGDSDGPEVGADVFASKLARLRQLRQKARETGADDGSPRLTRVTQKILAHKGAVTPSSPSTAGPLESGNSRVPEIIEHRLHDDASVLARPAPPASQPQPNLQRPTDKPSSQAAVATFHDAPMSVVRQHGLPLRPPLPSTVALPASQSQDKPAAAVAVPPAAGTRYRESPSATPHVAAALGSSAPSVGPAAVSVREQPAPANPAVTKVQTAGVVKQDNALPVGATSTSTVPRSVGIEKPPDVAAGAGGRLKQPPQSTEHRANRDAQVDGGSCSVGAAAAAAAAGDTSDNFTATITISESAPVKPSRTSKKKKKSTDSAALAESLQDRVHDLVVTNVAASSIPAPSPAPTPNTEGDAATANCKQYPADLNPFGADESETDNNLLASGQALKALPESHQATGLSTGQQAKVSIVVAQPSTLLGHGGNVVPSATYRAAAAAASTAAGSMTSRSVSTIASSRPSMVSRDSTYDSSLNPFGPDDDAVADKGTQGVPPTDANRQPPLRPPHQQGSSSLRPVLQRLIPGDVQPPQQVQQPRKKLVPDVEFDFEHSFEEAASAKRRQKAPAPARPSVVPLLVEATHSSVNFTDPRVTATAAEVGVTTVSSAKVSLGLACSDSRSASASPAVTPTSARKKKHAPVPPVATASTTATAVATSVEAESHLAAPIMTAGVPISSPRASTLQPDRQAELTGSGDEPAVASDIELRPPQQQQSTAGSSTVELQQQLSKKARPAPPRPMPPGRRSIASAESELGMTLLEVERELQTVDRKQRELEEQGRILEEAIRRADVAVTSTEQDDEQLAKWLEMVNEKNRLVRRESELVYVCKQHELEERQADIEWDLRQIMNKPECQKTDADKRQEEDLLQEMIAVVQERNKLVESLDQDRLRQLEEDKEIEFAMSCHAIPVNGGTGSPASTDASHGIGSSRGKAKKEKKGKDKKSKAVKS